MSGYLNRVQLIGNLGRDPDVYYTKEGGKIVGFDIATSESWVDEDSGERRERTEWHRVVIFNKGLSVVAEKYLCKGMKVYIEGQLRTHKWQDQSGADRRNTQIELTPFNGTLKMLGGKKREERLISDDDATCQSVPVDVSMNFADPIPF